MICFSLVSNAGDKAAVDRHILNFEKLFALIVDWPDVWFMRSEDRYYYIFKNDDNLAGELFVKAVAMGFAARLEDIDDLEAIGYKEPKLWSYSP